MHLKKALSLLLCGTLILSLSACGSSKTEETVEEATDEVVVETVLENSIAFSDGEFSDTTFTGTVTAVDGEVITLSVATVDGSAVDMIGGMTGGQPDGDMGSSDKPDGDAPSGDKPDGDAPSGDKPDGDAPSGGMDGGQGGGPGGDAPSGDKPDGDAPSGDMDGGQCGGPGGDAPDGNAPGGQPELPEGETDGTHEAPTDMEFETVTVTLTIADESVLQNSDGSAAALTDIEEGSFLTVDLDSDGNLLSVTLTDMENNMEIGMGGPGGGTSGVDSYDAVQEYTQDAEVTGGEFISTGTDENAIHIYDSASVALSDISVTRTSDDSTGGDNSIFYGVGAALLVSDDGTAYIDGGTFLTDAAGGAGIFAYGTGTAYVADTDITTNQDTSGGIHVAGGGTLYAWDLNVETNGESSAAIRSDRGSGTIVVDGGSYTSNGTGSPAVYCTADISVNGADLTATSSEAVCIEGLNTLRLYDCNLTGAIQDNSQNECNWNIIVYQSMSGDSEVGNGTFSMIGGSLTAQNGGMFYTTNTECTFYISDVDITYADENDFFLRCTGNVNQRGWGSAGNNGSQCNFTADSQSMEGDVLYDSISELDFYMTNASTLTGAFTDDESCAGNGGSGYCNVYISSDSEWIVTGDSVITALYNEGSIVDEDGNAVTIIGTDGTVYVEGASSYTITVYSYEASADLSGAATGDTFADHEVDRAL